MSSSSACPIGLSCFSLTVLSQFEPGFFGFVLVLEFDPVRFGDALQSRAIGRVKELCSLVANDHRCRCLGGRGCLLSTSSDGVLRGVVADSNTWTAGNQ